MIILAAVRKILKRSCSARALPGKRLAQIVPPITPVLRKVVIFAGGVKAPSPGANQSQVLRARIL